MIYTVRRDGKFVKAFDGKHIEDIRRWIYWNMKEGLYEIYKEKKLMGKMYRGCSYWGYEPETGYNRAYYVNSAGYLKDMDWEVC